MFLCSSQKMEKQMSFENEWISKFWNIHTMSYCLIMKRNKLVLQAKTLMNLNYAEWKKPNKKEDILHESIYRKLKNPQTRLRWQKADPWRPRMGEHVEKGGRDEWQGVLRRILGVMDMLALITMMFSQVYTHGKTYQAAFPITGSWLHANYSPWRNAKLLPISSQFYPI